MLLEKFRKWALKTHEQMEEIQQELDAGTARIAETEVEMKRIVSYAEIFDKRSMEIKKMICGALLKWVTVYRDYRLEVEFSITLEQFLRGIDSVEKTDLAKLPQAN